MSQSKKDIDLLDRDYLVEKSIQKPFLINPIVLLYTGIFGSVFTSCLLICYNLYVLKQKRKIISVLLLGYIFEFRVFVYFLGFEDGLYFIYKYFFQIILSIGIAYPLFNNLFAKVKFQHFEGNKPIYITLVAVIYGHTLGHFLLVKLTQLIMMLYNLTYVYLGYATLP